MEGALGKWSTFGRGEGRKVLACGKGCWSYKMALTLHLAKQWIPLLTGWTKTLSADESKLNALGEKLVEAMKEVRQLIHLLST